MTTVHHWPIHFLPCPSAITLANILFHTIVNSPLALNWMFGNKSAGRPARKVQLWISHAQKAVWMTRSIEIEMCFCVTITMRHLECNEPTSAHAISTNQLTITGMWLIFVTIVFFKSKISVLHGLFELSVNQRHSLVRQWNTFSVYFSRFCLCEEEFDW